MLAFDVEHAISERDAMTEPLTQLQAQSFEME